MVLDTIQLGVKRPQGKSLSSAKLRGFFYGEVGEPGGRLVRFQQYPARQHLIFYDNPSQKRLPKCTNILRTGPLPSVRGEGQRLRKGFQNVGVANITLNCCCGKDAGVAGKTGVYTYLPIKPSGQSTPRIYESSSSAAEIRHLAKNTRL
jgi:hypothetical protein